MMFSELIVDACLFFRANVEIFAGKLQLSFDYNAKLANIFLKKRNRQNLFLRIFFFDNAILK